jgi:CRISPR type IV-associated protein Csf3
MNHAFLRVTAQMSTALAVYDQWTPSLDSILEERILTNLDSKQANPSSEEIERTRPIVSELMPLKKIEIRETWFWSVSSPIYATKGHHTDRYRKRWDSHDKNLNWGNRRAKFATDHSGEKSYDLPLFTVLTPKITWYAIGDQKEVLALVKTCSHLGKKRSYGNGEVKSWQVDTVTEDRSLVYQGALMRPIPVEIIDQFNIESKNPVMLWGYNPPGWYVKNKKLCAMPQLSS